MVMPIDVEGLSEEDCRLVAQFVGYLRRTPRDPDVRAFLIRHWEVIRNAPDVLTPDEADALAAEAVAYVRAHA
jgi:hypothetical protein